MSIWYQHKIKAFAKDRAAVAKFFKLDDSIHDVRTDMFEFSYGGKNAPSLTLKKIVQENPDIIFFGQENVEVDTVGFFVTRWDVVSNQQQFFWIQDFGSVSNKVSKKLLEEYEQESPGLALKHLNGQEGYEKFRWENLFFDFDKAADKLNRAEEYREMVNPWEHYNVPMYVMEFEMTFGGDYHKERQGPMSLGDAEKAKSRLMKYNADYVKNIIIKQAEPK